MRTKDQIDTGTCPLQVTACAITTFEDFLFLRICLPFCTHVQQIDEEVCGQYARSISEDTVLRLIVIGIQHTHTADQCGHFWSSQGHELSLVYQEFFGGHGEGSLLIVTEAICLRLQYREGVSIGLLLCRVSATSSERHFNVISTSFGSLLNCSTTTKYNQVSHGDLLATTSGSIEGFLNTTQCLEYFSQLLWLVCIPILLRS